MDCGASELMLALGLPLLPLLSVVVAAVSCLTVVPLLLLPFELFAGALSAFLCRSRR